MKSMKRVLALVLALVMCLGLATVAMAADGATITVENAAKGETYTLYRLFDASVTGENGGSIVYTGTIPDTLKTYFEKDANGYIVATDAAGNDQAMSEGLKSALAEWTQNAVATKTEPDWKGGQLTFTDLDYGYYVVKSTQGNNSAISVSSTNPNATMYDKNDELPKFDHGTEPKTGKFVNDKESDTVSVGETVTYKIVFQAANYTGTDENAKMIASYTVSDSLPKWLENPRVTSITVQEGSDEPKQLEVQQFNNKSITLSWLDEEELPAYKNGALVTITYDAKVGVGADDELITYGTQGNVNTATLSWTDKDNGSYTPLTSTATIFTYALAIQKVDEKGANLSGAKFSLAGVSAKGTPGHYVVTDADDKDAVTTLECDSDGYLAVYGLKEASYTVTEVEAPRGYAKLAETKTLPVVKAEDYAADAGSVQYNKQGEKIEANSGEEVFKTVENATTLQAGQMLVVNEKGNGLPSTGGIGTTIFYVIGGILVVGAGVLLVTKKRMAHHD